MDYFFSPARWFPGPRMLPIPSTIRYRRAIGRLDRIIYGIIRERRGSGRDPERPALPPPGRPRRPGSGDDRPAAPERGGHARAGRPRDDGPGPDVWLLPAGQESRGRGPPRGRAGGRPRGPGRRPPTCRPCAMPSGSSARRCGSIPRLDDRPRGPGRLRGRGVMASRRGPSFSWPSGSRTATRGGSTTPNRSGPNAGPTTWSSASLDARFPLRRRPRICIGNHFAMMEAILILATIARRYRLALASGQPLELVPTITLRPKHGIRMVAHGRRGRRPGMSGEPRTRIQNRAKA